MRKRGRKRRERVRERARMKEREKEKKKREKGQACFNIPIAIMSGHYKLIIIQTGFVFYYLFL